MAEVRVFTVPADPQRAVAACATALGRLSSQRFSFEECDEAIPSVSLKGKGTVAVPARMLVIYSAKGGVGKTTIAENLAAVLGLWGKAQESATGVPCRTALLDFNLDGSTGVYLWCSRGTLKTVSLWEDFLSNVPRWADVAAVMNYHEKTGVYYLAPPLSPDEKVRFGRELAETIVSICRKFFHFVVVDSGVAIKDRDATAVCLTAATDILLVTDFKYRTLRLLADIYRRELKYIIDETKTSMVLNRVKRTWFSTQDFIAAFAKEAGTAIPLKGELPEEPGLERKEGETGKIPFVCMVPDAPFSRAVYTLVRNILGVDVSLTEVKNTGGRGFSRLFSLFRRGK
jgi:Flp pilus assembly CpaE family ATPase